MEFNWCINFMFTVNKRWKLHVEQILYLTLLPHSITSWINDLVLHFQLLTYYFSATACDRMFSYLINATFRSLMENWLFKIPSLPYKLFIIFSLPQNLNLICGVNLYNWPNYYSVSPGSFSYCLQLFTSLRMIGFWFLLAK